MGRVLSWTLSPKDKLLFDVEDLKVMYNVSAAIGKQCEWTCDSFCVEPGVFPNFETGKTWKFIERRRRNLLTKGMHLAEADLKIVEEGTAFFHNPEWQKSIWGFCKIAGNELNAMMITLAMTAISTKLDCSIKLDDEGKFLIVPIILENGMARPDGDRIDGNIAYWMTRHWVPGYADCGEDWEKMSEKHFDLKEKYKSRYSPQRCEWQVDKFCRKVKPEDFKDHPEFSAKEIMSGFWGTYYNLSDKDEEKESYKISALMQKMLGKVGEKGRMEVAPKLNLMSDGRDDE